MSELPRYPRRYLGRTHSFTERVRTYWTDEALEVDGAENYVIRRRRVFFDEILLVTLHPTRGVLSAALPFALALLFTITALASTASDVPDVARFCWVMTGVFVLVAAGIAVAPVWVVTVYGKRTRARMHFRLRQAKARAIYAEICRAAADAQRALAARLAGEAPEPPLPPPLPLSESELSPPPEEPSVEPSPAPLEEKEY